MPKDSGAHPQYPPEHDLPGNFEVVFNPVVHGCGGGYGRHWAVRRVCSCHRYEIVSMPFDSLEKAGRCLKVLSSPVDADRANDTM